MKVLLLDTCGIEGSVVLADTDSTEPVVALARMPGRTASERLVAVVRASMDEAGWRLRELSAIAVVTGPGSFTGVRVGLSAAKGLSEASGVPLIAVSRLAILGAAAQAGEGHICALLDAGRKEFYCGRYQNSVELGEALLSREEAIATVAAGGAVVVCEEAVVEALGDSVALQIVAEPTAADALPFALKRMAEASFDDPMTLDANYLRRTDAEIFAKPVSQRVG